MLHADKVLLQLLLLISKEDYVWLVVTTFRSLHRRGATLMESEKVIFIKYSGSDRTESCYLTLQVIVEHLQGRSVRCMELSHPAVYSSTGRRAVLGSVEPS